MLNFSYIVEDDSMAEICYDSSIAKPNFISLDTYHRVVYIKSFSKLMMPGHSNWIYRSSTSIIHIDYEC